MRDAEITADVWKSRAIRRLAWMTVALAFAPLMGLMLVVLFEAFVPPQGHNPFLASGRPWVALLMVLAITAPAHVPYVTVLCITAWGLFRRRAWARIVALILTPLAAILSLFAWGGTISALYSWRVEGLQGSNLKETIIAFSPTAILSTTYSVTAVIVLWNRDIGATDALPKSKAERSDH
jgi:hypothetical protein